MERDAIGLEAEPMGVLQHVRGHLGLAAELARQRPFGAGAVAQDAAEHLRAGRGAGDLLDLGLAVDREQADAEREGARDVALLLDGVAEGDAVRRWRRRRAPSRSRRPRRCRSRSRARPAATAPPAPGSPSRRRTRGCPAAPWRRCCSCRARRRDRRRGTGPSSRRLRRNSRMRVGHGALPKQLMRARAGRVRGECLMVKPRCRAMEDTTDAGVQHPTMLPWIGWGDPVRTPGNEGQASSVT